MSIDRRRRHLARTGFRTLSVVAFLVLAAAAIAQEESGLEARDMGEPPRPRRDTSALPAAARDAMETAASTPNALIEVRRLVPPPAPRAPEPYHPLDTDRARATRIVQRLDAEGASVVLGRPASLLVHWDGQAEFVDHALRTLPGSYDPYDPSGFAIVGPPGARRLLTGFDTTPNLHLYELDEALHPSFDRELIGCGPRLIPLGDKTQAVTFGRCAAILDTATGDLRAYLADAADRVAVKGDALALASTEGDAGLVATFRLADDGRADALASVGTSVAEIFLDDAGEIVVVQSKPEETGRTRFEIRDASTLALFATIPADDVTSATLVGGGAHPRVLAIGSIESLLFFDLGKPASPSYAGSIGRPFTVLDAVSGTHVVAREDGLSRPRLVLIDATSATEEAVWVTAGAMPIAVAHGEAGSRLAVVSQKMGDRKIFEPGGYMALDLLESAGGGMFARVSGASGMGVRRVVDDLVHAWQGRYAVLVDYESNSILAFDTASGETIPVGGFSHFGPSGAEPDCATRMRGDWLARGCRWNGAETVRLSSAGILDRVRRIVKLDIPGPEWNVSLFETTSDGTLFLWDRDGVLVAAPGETDVRLDFPSTPGPYPRGELSPSETRLLLHGQPTFTVPHFLAMVDVSDRRAPRLLWTKEDDPLLAGFVRRDEAVLLTYGDFLTIAPRLFDGTTGEALGPSGAPQFIWFEHGIGARWSTTDRDYAVTWNWEWWGDATMLWDLTSPTPELVRERTYVVSPEYAPKADGSGWYELHDVRSWHQPGPPLLYTGGLDGKLTPGGLVDAGRFVPLRHGFVLGAGGMNRRDIVVLRDPLLNRAPVAVTGGDRVVECMSAEGTTVPLDGSESFDPDSAPGTQDDIAAFAWTLDGVGVSQAAAFTADLALGAHDAQLAVTDALGAVDTKVVRIEVADTIEPEVALGLDPVVAGGVFARRFAVAAAATDICDDAIGAPGVTLLLPPEFATAAVTFTGGAPAAELVAVRGASGLAVNVRASTAAEAERLWSAMQGAGEIPLATNEPALWWSSRAAPGAAAGLHYRYRLTGDGLLVAAEAYGPETDHTLRARVADRSGNEGEARVSYRERVRELCAAAGPAVLCAP